MSKLLTKYINQMTQLEKIALNCFYREYYPQVDDSAIYFEGFYYSAVQNVTLELIYYPESEIYQFYTEIEGEQCLFNFSTHKMHLGELVYLGR